MAKKRICVMCGKEYEWCIHCTSSKPEEAWKFMYHDEKCMDIGNIWYAYRGKEIPKEEARIKLSQIKPNIDDVLKYHSIAANEIRDIFGIKLEEDVEQVEPKVEEKVEPKVETKPVPEKKPDNQQFGKYNNKKK